MVFFFFFFNKFSIKRYHLLNTNKIFICIRPESMYKILEYSVKEKRWSFVHVAIPFCFSSSEGNSSIGGCQLD